MFIPFIQVTSVTDANSFLAGASGGVYALLLGNFNKKSLSAFSTKFN
jgi:hypothetical protein